MIFRECRELLLFHFCLSEHLIFEIDISKKLWNELWPVLSGQRSASELVHCGEWRNDRLIKVPQNSDAIKIRTKRAISSHNWPPDIQRVAQKYYLNWEEKNMDKILLQRLSLVLFEGFRSKWPSNTSGKQCLDSVINDHDCLIEETV